MVGRPSLEPPSDILSAAILAFGVIEALLKEWRPALVVVGLPAHADGVEHEMSARCRRFAHQLEGRFGLKVVLVDERHSSTAASEDLNEAGVRGRKQKAVLDMIFSSLQKKLAGTTANRLSVAG